MENIAQTLTLLLSAGLYHPIPTAIWGGVYVLGVIVYLFGYYKNPATRIYGASIVLGSRFALPIFTIVSLA